MMRAVQLLDMAAGASAALIAADIWCGTYRGEDD